MWQELHAELEPIGLTVVTVALDTDVDAARPFAAAASPSHPSLVDPALSMVAAFGITNVPFGVWVDESGTIVRPAEVAFAPRAGRGGGDAQDQAGITFGPGVAGQDHLTGVFDDAFVERSAHRAAQRGESAAR